MKGGDPTAQIPENFPKQRREVPQFYKYLDGKPVVRTDIPLELVHWNTKFDGSIPEYTSPIVIYHSVLACDPWNPDANFDPEYKEFNPVLRK